MVAGVLPFSASAATAADTSAWDGSTIDTNWWDESENAFTISTAAEFAGLLQLSRGGQAFRGKTITLTSDIAFNYVKVSGRNFDGILDGGNHILKSRNTDSLFSWVSGTIQNLGIEVSGSGLDGAFANSLTATGTITNCALRVIGASGDAGMVRDCRGRIQRSYVFGSGSVLGHLAHTAYAGSVFANCYSELQTGSLVYSPTRTGSGYPVFLMRGPLRRQQQFSQIRSRDVAEEVYGAEGLGQ
jgi:hypothetical protein